MIIGRCIGEISLLEVDFISNSMPQVGEYVSIKYDGKNVLGMIENLVRGNVALNSEIYDVDDIETITKVSGNDLYVKGKVRLLGDVDDNLKLPRIPAPPGTPITKADDELLKKVFNLKNICKKQKSKTTGERCWF